MRILITGGTGFIGSHIVQSATKAGHAVVVLARSPSKVPKVLEPLGCEPTDIVPGDATDPRAVQKAVDGCDAVIHAAAVVAMDRSAAKAAHRANVDAGITVLSEASKHQCDPIVHVSSASVFELATSPMGLDSELRIAEGSYARAKTDLELFARGMQAAGAPVVTTYPTGVFGPNAPTPTAVHDAAVTWVGSSPSMTGGISIVDVRDVAAAHVALLEPGRGPCRYVLGGTSVTWPQLYDAIEAATGASITRLPVSSAMLRQMGRFLDITRIPVPTSFPLTHEAMSEATTAPPVDSGDAESDLEFEFRDLHTTLQDSYRWMRDQGLVSQDDVPSV